MAIIKARAVLAYSEDRQNQLQAKVKPSTASMHFINNLTLMSVVRVHVKAGDTVEAGSKLITVRGFLKPRSIVPAVIDSLSLGGSQNTTRGSTISGRSVRVALVPIELDIDSTRVGVIQNVLVNEGDDIVGGQAIASIGDKFNKTFKLSTLNAVVQDGGRIASHLRTKLVNEFVHPPMFNVHVTIVKGQEHQALDHAAWGKHEGRVIEFEYDDSKVEWTRDFAWVQVYSNEFMELRRELGLSLNHHLHMTIGRK